MYHTTSEEWAQLVFGQSDLGDSRRTDRLVKLTSDMASHVGSSIVKASENPASIEGAYRFISNPCINPEQIALSGYKFTDSIVKQRPLVLAIQDTTGLSYRHSICSELGSVSSAMKTSKNPVGRSIFVHSTMMMDANTEQVIGLANQHYWFREEKSDKKSEKIHKRPIKDKESFKWQRNIEELSARMDSLDNVLDICDREADIYEYLSYQVSQGHRFIVRAKENRLLNQPANKLRELTDAIEPHHYTIQIKQKGGRKERKARIAISYQSITIKKPKRGGGEPELNVNVIVCQEIGANDIKEKLCWILYTTEDITTIEQARQLVRFYELRWRIEEFHKAWKTDGTQVEKLRIQSCNNLKRVAVIQAFIAIRIMQLQELAQNKESAKEISCEPMLTRLSWKILWKKTESKKAMPDAPPSLYWAYYAIAKLGGWYDSKRTGRVGMKAMWSGWIKLMTLVEAVEIVEQLKME